MPYDKKGWIHFRDREDYGIDNEAEELSTPISKSKSESQPEPKKNASPAPDSSKPVSKKVSLPILPKLDHLKISTNSSNTENVVSEPADISNNNNKDSMVIEFLDILLAREQSDDKHEPLGIPNPLVHRSNPSL